MLESARLDETEETSYNQSRSTHKKSFEKRRRCLGPTPADGSGGGDARRGQLRPTPTQSADDDGGRWQNTTNRNKRRSPPACLFGRPRNEDDSGLALVSGPVNGTTKPTATTLTTTTINPIGSNSVMFISFRYHRTVSGIPPKKVDKNW